LNRVLDLLGVRELPTMPFIFLSLLTQRVIAGQAIICLLTHCGRG
jgi:hypothetical protein